MQHRTTEVYEETNINYKRMRMSIMRDVNVSLDELYVRHLQKQYERTRKYETRINHLSITNANIHNNSIENAHFKQCHIINCDLRLTAECCVFHSVTFENCKFYHVEFNKCIFINCLFTQCEFKFSKFTICTLRRSTFNEMTFIYASFYCSMLNLVRFEKSNITGSHIFDFATLLCTTLDEAVLQHYSEGQILTEDLIGYKKSREGVIIQLRIPKGAIVFSINNSKCRTNKVIVEKFINTDLTELSSAYNTKFKYHVGDVLTIQDFNMRYNSECESGIHFFKTIEEAVAYNIITYHRSNV